ncbi:MAG: PepSY-associated TM helix domain-containing protein, partial [Pirellula sp.]
MNQRTPLPTPKRTYRWIATLTRWLHIYISLFGLAVILFFSATGLTLNHPNWFFRESTTQSTGNLETRWLRNGNPPPLGWDQADYGHEVSKLEIVEMLRTRHRIHGQVSSFLAFSDECEVGFEGPGYAATARIQRDNGEYTLDVTSNDLISVLNDLHKGRHTSAAWSWLIDGSAIIGVLTGITGFGLIFFLRLRRTT